jgi:hydrogenase expression/formation protein HypC
LDSRFLSRKLAGKAGGGDTGLPITDNQEYEMCVALPMKLTKLEGTSGVAEMEGLEVNINTMLLPDAKEGDYVIVHAGFAIQLLDEEEAQKSIELFRQIAEQDPSG